jgi:hypothetical protein
MAVVDCHSATVIVSALALCYLGGCVAVFAVFAVFSLFAALVVLAVPQRWLTLK